MASLSHDWQLQCQTTRRWRKKISQGCGTSYSRNRQRRAGHYFGAVMRTSRQGNRSTGGNDGDDVCRVTEIEIAAQKKSLHAAERESGRVELRRAEYQAEMAGKILSRLKFLDEAGSNLAMTRLYGRAAKGERVIESVPQNYGENITILATLGLSGITAPMTINGAVDGSVFKVYVEEVLCPTLREDDVVVMDNLPAHKVSGIRELIESKGAKLIYLPPYSPDMNPIEKCWSKIKTYLRKAKARTRAELEKAFREALLLITEEDAVGWFKSCGYTIH